MRAWIQSLRARVRPEAAVWVATVAFTLCLIAASYVFIQVARGGTGSFSSLLLSGQVLFAIACVTCVAAIVLSSDD